MAKWIVTSVRTIKQVEFREVECDNPNDAGSTKGPDGKPPRRSESTASGLLWSAAIREVSMVWAVDEIPPPPGTDPKKWDGRIYTKAWAIEQGLVPFRKMNLREKIAFLMKKWRQRKVSRGR